MRGPTVGWRMPRLAGRHRSDPVARAAGWRSRWSRAAASCSRTTTRARASPRYGFPRAADAAARARRGRALAGRSRCRCSSSAGRGDDAEPGRRGPCATPRWTRWRCRWRRAARRWTCSASLLGVRAARRRRARRAGRVRARPSLAPPPPRARSTRRSRRSRRAGPRSSRGSCARRVARRPRARARQRRRCLGGRRAVARAADRERCRRWRCARALARSGRAWTPRAAARGAVPILYGARARSSATPRRARPARPCAAEAAARAPRAPTPSPRACRRAFRARSTRARRARPFVAFDFGSMLRSPPLAKLSARAPSPEGAPPPRGSARAQLRATLEDALRAVGARGVWASCQARPVEEHDAAAEPRLLRERETSRTRRFRAATFSCTTAGPARRRPRPKRPCRRSSARSGPTSPSGRGRASACASARSPARAACASLAVRARRGHARVAAAARARAGGGARDARAAVRSALAAEACGLDVACRARSRRCFDHLRVTNRKRA